LKANGLVTRFPWRCYKRTMLILAIDTALEACSVAVLDTAQGELRACESVLMGRGHAEALMPMIARVMKQAQIPFADVDRIAVTTGPGSFTGLRVGISAARGIALAADKPAVGVTTLSAFAAPLLSEDTSQPIASVIDARHGNVYFQVVSCDGAPLVEPSVVTISEVFEAARFGGLRLVGNAAHLVAGQWPENIDQPVLVDMQPAPDIAWIGWLGAVANPQYATPRPFYLRAPDAKPQIPANLLMQSAP
jgi:tRNA threonylcarbamoyladenosine biosynthesis protein TsaB